jgi:hypothetical protein
MSAPAAGVLAIRGAALPLSLGGGCPHARGLATAAPSTKTAIVRRNVLRKMRQGVARLASQGPDPAVSSATPLGWRIAAAAVVE